MARPHGTKYIKTPEALAELFEKYVEETKAKPRRKHTFVGKDGKSEYELLEVPLTMEGFRIYAFNLVGSIKHYFENRDNSYSDYVPICSHIRDIIRRDQIEGGMVGQYNPSITQRLNGLKESTETEIKGTLNIPNLPDIGNRGKK